MLFLLLACVSPTTGLDALRACEDPACQEATLDQALVADPDGTLAWVAEQPDALVQVALVTAVAARDPALLSGRCGGLLPEAAQRCDRFVERPHLRQAPAAAAAGLRPGGGPARPTPPVPDRPALVADPAARAEIADRCAGDRSCAGQAARDAGAALQPAVAKAACDILPPGDLSRDECLFRAAESAVATAGLDGLDEAVDLCVASAFSGDCLAHCLALTTPPAVPADAVEVAAVREMAEHAERVAAVLGGEAGRQAASLTWNLWVNAAFGVGSPGTGPEVRGDLLDLVPPEAAPHVRFAAASQVAMSRPQETVQGLVVATRQALERRGEVRPVSMRRPVVVPRIGGQLWERDLPGEEQIPATWARGPTRRPTSADPEVDLQLAVLAALAMNPGRPPARHLQAVMGDAGAHDHVRWAAALALGLRAPRLLSEWVAAHPEAPALVKGRAG